jgi:hypothetical protein
VVVERDASGFEFSWMLTGGGLAPSARADARLPRMSRIMMQTCSGDRLAGFPPFHGAVCVAK